MANPEPRRKSVAPKVRSYAVVRSLFGDFWVGHCDAKPDNVRIFSSIHDAKKVAETKTYARFLSDDEEYLQIEDIKGTTEENCESVPKGWVP